MVNGATAYAVDPPALAVAKVPALAVPDCTSGEYTKVYAPVADIAGRDAKAVPAGRRQAVDLSGGALVFFRGSCAREDSLGRRPDVQA